jgi:hypothetical protein
MGQQLHKRFSTEMVQSYLERYLDKTLELSYLLDILGIKRRRFFQLLNRHQTDPKHFSLVFPREKPPRTLAPEIEINIFNELALEKVLIVNPDLPIRTYNYSYIQDELFRKYQQKVSLPTIINRAKKHGFFQEKPPKKTHDREVLTHYIGELIQHDSSHHRFSPSAEDKWYLITSLDDYSRMIVFAQFVLRETSWNHIQALETVWLRYGFPYSYYVDNHSIFRFVQTRDSFWRKHQRLTDEINPQWKQVLDECRVKIAYALSPQAKGKIERPFQWLQDRIVRFYYRENTTTIEEGQQILNNEMNRYNYHQVHSTTGEIPALRMAKAFEQGKSLFREFTLPVPFQSTKDIFCLRAERVVNPYRKISFQNVEFKVPGVPIREKVQLRIVPDDEMNLAEIRFWYKSQLVGIEKIKCSELKLVQF